MNFDRARLYLHGGSGDDRFLLKTFLVLREDIDNPEEVTNLMQVFGGTGSKRYSYLESGPVEINGGPALPFTDNLAVTKHGDTYHILFRDEFAGLAIDPRDIDTSLLEGTVDFDTFGSTSIIFTDLNAKGQRRRFYRGSSP